MDSPRIELSIVIANYNTLDLLRRCLDNIFGLELDLRFEIIIVDNASRDGSQDWLKGMKDQRVTSVFSTENRGFAGGCNSGIRQSNGEHILLLNTDAFPQPGAIEALVDYLDAHAQVGIVGPQLLYPNGQWQRSSGRIPSPRTAILGTLGIVSVEHIFRSILWRVAERWCRPRPVEYVDGACMLIRRKVFDEVGLLNEDFFFFVEDAEFCLRARKKGWSIFQIPNSRVVHLRGGGMSSLEDMSRRAGLKRQSLQRFITEHYGEKGWKRYARWAYCKFRVRYLLCVAASSLHLASAERCTAYRTLADCFGESVCSC